MRVSWWRPHEVVLARVLLVVCAVMAPVSLVWLWIVDDRAGAPMAFLACGVPLVALIPYLGPTIHALDVVPDGLVLHDVLGRSRPVHRTAVGHVLLVPALASIGRYQERTTISRIVVVGADGRAVAHGSWLSSMPDAERLRTLGVPVETMGAVLEPRDLDRQVPGSTTLLERAGRVGVWVTALGAIAIMVGVIALELAVIP